MRKLAILTFQTLDGIMQSPTSPEEDPSDGFTDGGWATTCWDEVMEQVMREAMSEPYDLLLGRKTYELFAPNWLNAADDNPVAMKLNNATKYVVTSTLSELEWNNSIAITGDIATEITRLKKQEGDLLQVHGSWQLIQTLLAHDLIDEYRLWTFPIIIGSGKRLFGNGRAPKNLKLIESDICPTGAVMSIYSRN
ncbi:MAG: dihydrofolate reductase [Rhodospirillaceae bacterium]|jgi:dihydrofolate reductase|nr:dihydrofolate reductase [Rhodospirillaceae bacterium]MBT4691626.1 dihydrofolate reductase [Rhodospirillaceae bacterium]MBT5081278.1 dihydrofolate reductase [Rhodospirillaceae bacterium]MBT5523718.1 dihydrofolate reductase [Rhodospirillaceae bacterium]MBT5878309.1 dihydrofolate reductase [Rhodospirillaceae bacterium]